MVKLIIWSSAHICVLGRFINIAWTSLPTIHTSRSNITRAHFAKLLSLPAPQYWNQNPDIFKIFPLKMNHTQNEILHQKLITNQPYVNIQMFIL